MSRIQIADVAISTEEIQELLATDHPMVERFRFEKNQGWRDGLYFSLVIEPRSHEGVGMLIGGSGEYSYLTQLNTVLEVSRDPEVVGSFATFSNSFSAALSDSLCETDPDDRDAVVDVLVALFGSLMRGWWLGRISMREVHDRTDRAIALLYRGAHEA